MEHQVTLSEMLDARENRALRQQRLLNQYHTSLICFTMNIAGPVKNSPRIREGFELGKHRLESLLASRRLSCTAYEEVNEPTGNEAFYLIDADPILLKEITCTIEDGPEPGRLFDMDVLGPAGEKADRETLGLPPRSCLICGGPAKACARSRAHTLEELETKTREMLTEGIAKADAADIARLACRALLYEVCTTPKPGLVDRFDSGSHKDMDIFTFMDSASALWPYFEACGRIGKETASLTAPDTFLRIRPCGRMAETDMLFATRGVNTHKGAVFSMGILCAALGRLPRSRWKEPDRILEECAAMTAGLVAEDFAGLTEENAKTVGQKLYLRYQITGVRGQMEAGLPAVGQVGLPVLKAGLARGLSINDAGCAALLALMTAAVDTNLISRSSYPDQQEIAAQIQALIQENPFPDREVLSRLNEQFMARNLSPGGSADLLAVCYFLYFLENEV